MPRKSRISSGGCSKVSGGFRTFGLSSDVIKRDSYLIPAKKIQFRPSPLSRYRFSGVKADENKKNKPSIIRQILTRIMRGFYDVRLLCTWFICTASHEYS